MSTQRFLQNHPNYRTFPVRFGEVKPDYSNLLIAIVMITLLMSLLSIIGLIIFVISWIDWMNISSGFLTVIKSIWLMAAILIILSIYLAIKHLSSAKREQYRYYRLTNTGHLTREKRQALSLDLNLAYSNSYWPESLECYPLEWRVPLHKKQFKLLHLHPAEEFKALQKKWWGIESKEDVISILERLLTGMHTPLFANDLKKSKDFLYQLLKQLNFSLDKVDDILGNKETPPQLIWGFDLWRVVTVARDAFSAQYLTEDEAWYYILQAYRLSTQIFKTRDDFFDNASLGRLYWGGEEQIKYIDLIREQYTACDWPQRSLPWTSKKVELPEYIKTGFGII